MGQLGKHKGELEAMEVQMHNPYQKANLGTCKNDDIKGNYQKNQKEFGSFV